VLPVLWLLLPALLPLLLPCCCCQYCSSAALARDAVVSFCTASAGKAMGKVVNASVGSELDIGIDSGCDFL
jgi:hypothetical protein